MNRLFFQLRPIPTANESYQSRVVQATGDKRVEQLVSSMTLKEKIDYISGVKGFCIRALPRLGIPEIWMSDATSGVRGVNVPVTIFPSAIALSASWSRVSAEKMGLTIAKECRATGVSVLLAPGINIARVPICGRNFEYMGEDPYLTGQIARAYVDGVQSQQVAVTVKHFVCNNSEYDRHKCNSVVTDKVLHELYLPAFETVITSGASGVMTAYNPINGSYASEHTYLINDILQKRWGFTGMVVSDWNSLYSTEGPLFNGVDIEMPKGKWFTQKALFSLIQKHPEYEKFIDRKIQRLLATFERMGMLDRPVVDVQAEIGTDGHAYTAYSIASESVVLIKNNNILPLESTKLTKIVVVGSFALSEPIGGGGSSFIGQGEPAPSVTAMLTEQLPHSSITTLTGSWWKSFQNRALVAQADVVIGSVGFGHTYESEAYDRQWELPSYDRKVIDQVSALNKNIVLSVHAGAAVEMESYLDKVQAILYSWYLGSFSAKVIVDILLGITNPSGKLPISIARKLADYESMKNYPSDFAKLSFSRIQGGQGNPKKRKIWSMSYDEGLMVGYRQFDTVGPQALFPFGFGLSYTSFSYHNLEITKSENRWKITCAIKNEGSQAGSEVVQLYVRPSDANRDRPFQQLANFTKAFVEPGELKTVEMEIGERAFSVWDETQHDWGVISGIYTIVVGASSCDMRLSATVEI